MFISSDDIDDFEDATEFDEEAAESVAEKEHIVPQETTTAKSS